MNLVQKVDRLIGIRHVSPILVKLIIEHIIDSLVINDQNVTLVVPSDVEVICCKGVCDSQFQVFVLFWLGELVRTVSNHKRVVLAAALHIFWIFLRLQIRSNNLSGSTS